ncbi:hypothetical protein SNEBB_008893 [Seison nebaliae]|nr:hypothetical protein SNEBB_008893 [Seison nebaliae]
MEYEYLSDFYSENKESGLERSMVTNEDDDDEDELKNNVNYLMVQSNRPTTVIKPINRIIQRPNRRLPKKSNLLNIDENEELCEEFHSTTTTTKISSDNSKKKNIPNYLPVNDMSEKRSIPSPIPSITTRTMKVSTSSLNNSIISNDDHRKNMPIFTPENLNLLISSTIIQSSKDSIIPSHDGSDSDHLSKNHQTKGTNEKRTIGSRIQTFLFSRSKSHLRRSSKKMKRKQATNVSSSDGNSITQKPVTSSSNDELEKCSDECQFSTFNTISTQNDSLNYSWIDDDHTRHQSTNDFIRYDDNFLLKSSKQHKSLKERQREISVNASKNLKRNKSTIGNLKSIENDSEDSITDSTSYPKHRYETHEMSKSHEELFNSVLDSNCRHSIPHRPEISIDELRNKLKSVKLKQVNHETSNNSSNIVMNEFHSLNDPAELSVKERVALFSK